MAPCALSILRLLLALGRYKIKQWAALWTDYNVCSLCLCLFQRIHVKRNSSQLFRQIYCKLLFCQWSFTTQINLIDKFEWRATWQTLDPLSIAWEAFVGLKGLFALCWLARTYISCCARRRNIMQEHRLYLRQVVIRLCLRQTYFRVESGSFNLYLLDAFLLSQMFKCLRVCSTWLLFRWGDWELSADDEWVCCWNWRLIEHDLLRSQ